MDSTAATRAYLGKLEALARARGMRLDAAQQAAAARLQRLWDELVEFKQRRASRLKRLIAPPVPPRGLYLWGGVGRGKSLLMDVFYGGVPLRRKARVHFHAFMREVHAELQGLKREADPLRAVAARVAARHRLVCFDEFHVSDIADAMILGRLMSALLDLGVVFVLTSNYPPRGLWPDGLQRERFLPAVDLIEARLDVLEVDGGVDYRLRALDHLRTYWCPADAEAERGLARAFEAMRSAADGPRHLSVDGRDIAARRVAGGLAWFDFAALCGGPRSQRDYLELARRFHTLLLSGVPRMPPAMANEARRFTWMVDILYDHRVKLLLSAEVPAEQLYREGPHSREFSRTVSRLTEMRSHDYMALAHDPAEHGRGPAADRHTLTEVKVAGART